MPNDSELELSSRNKYYFSEKYTETHAHYYYEKHRHGIGRRLSNWLEQKMVDRALQHAGPMTTILDFPCGTGRMWPVLIKHAKNLLVADNSRAMIESGLDMRDEKITARIQHIYQCSAFESGLPDNIADCVASIRFLHHMHKSEDRINLLKEFKRLSKGPVIVSLWVDGNFKAWQLQRKKISGKAYKPRDRILISRLQFETEAAMAGFENIKSIDMLPRYEKWRTYILKPI